MKRLFAAIVLLPLAQGVAFAQSEGDAQAGKTLWEGANTQCRNCHGTTGEGAFGPDLAGRKLTLAQFKQAIRKPWGIMPAFVDSQVSDGDIANIHAYFSNLPANPEPGKWRFEVPANAPRGQQVLLNVGCGQCHGPQLDGPRANMGAVDMDFDWLKALVYNHTTALPVHDARLGERGPPRMRMGNFNPNRVTEGELRAIFNWAKNEAGFRARVVARLGKGASSEKGVTYTLTVENGGLPGRAQDVEDTTVRLIIPAGTEVVSATGAGYQGAKPDEQAKATVAAWQVSRLTPKKHEEFTITLSKAGTAADNLRGEVRWMKPAIKPGPFDRQPINAAPL
jgi:mono/diheme cytochrome c family protein